MAHVTAPYFAILSKQLMTACSLMLPCSCRPGVWRLKSLLSSRSRRVSASRRPPSSLGWRHERSRFFSELIYDALV